MEYQKNIYTGIPYGLKIDNLSDYYIGVRVIGDVHGMYDDYEKLVIEAFENKLFPIQLGDLVDRGPQSKDCLLLSLMMKHEGYGQFVAGNHEFKHYKYMLNPKLEVRDYHHRALKDLNKLTDDELFMFIEFMQDMHYRISWKNFRFSHAAYHPIFEEHDSRLLTSKDLKRIEQYSLYGPHSSKIVADWRNKYLWINDIPEGVVVVLGHNTYENISCVTNDIGGKAYFIDTGSGKDFVNGKLSYMDIMQDGSIDVGNQHVDYITMKDVLE